MSWPAAGLVCRVAKSTDLSDIYARREASERVREFQRVSELAFNGPSDKRRLSDKCVAWTLRWLMADDGRWIMPADGDGVCGFLFLSHKFCNVNTT